MLLADDTAAPEFQHAVGHAGDGGVVGDDDRGGAEFLIGARNRSEHQLAGIVVERPGRLVAQQHIRRFDDGACDRDPLLLTAGELRGKMIEPLGEADQRQRGPRIDRMLGNFVHQGDIFQHRQTWNEIVELKHETDMLAPIARQRGIVGIDEIMVAPFRLARGRRIKSAKDVEQRRLARAGRPQQHDEFPLIDVEVNIAQRMHLDLAHNIDLRQAAGVENRRAGARVGHGAYAEGRSICFLFTRSLLEIIDLD